MKIISWNVNSVRIRIHLLKDLIQKKSPDIICLQEIKVEEFLFPKEEISKLGYNFIEISGEKSYNGVAIISKIPIHGSSAIDILNYGHKRHISTTIDTKVGKIDLQAKKYFQRVKNCGTVRLLPCKDHGNNTSQRLEIHKFWPHANLGSFLVGRWAR
ncbi:MAG: hypothetical protein EBU93_05055 [Chlamydiae bacterium]|nr:hypothetical protein [Chlamydiota bacterium]